MSHKSTLKSLERELQEQLQLEDESRAYDWLDSAEGITWEKFSLTFPSQRLWLCTLLDVSPEGGSGWQQLAVIFGLKPEEIQWCEKFCGSVGPTACMFHKLSQKEPPPSLHLLLYSLNTLGRHDLLARIPWKQCIDKLKEDSIKEVISPTPTRVTSNVLQTASPTGHVKPKKRPYACSALMIYSSDARDFALKACKQFRSAGANKERGRIGVLLLEEQRNLLLADPSNTLHLWYRQVDFLIPVLSPGLLRDFTVWSSLTDDVEAVDALPMTSLLHRYIFRLALDNFVAKFSTNLKCRPIAPSRFRTEIISHEAVLSHSLLQVVSVCQEVGENQEFSESIEDFAAMLVESPRIAQLQLSNQ